MANSNMFKRSTVAFITLVVYFSIMMYSVAASANYFVPYTQIQQQHEMNEQLHQQNLYGDYPGGRNSSLQSYQAPTYYNDSNNSYNNQQSLYQQDNSNYYRGY